VSEFESWGRFPEPVHQSIKNVLWIDETKQNVSEITNQGKKFLPRGMGRSYGDSCLIDDGTLLVTTACNRIISFDRKTGIITTEAGVTLEQLIPLIVPSGWFLPVSPGTKYVSVAGAVANDIHGKNHHVAGNFGNHVSAFALLRSDGRTIICTENDTIESEAGQLFRATIGGMGLTGVILWVSFRLKPIQSPLIDQEIIKYKGLDQFIEISKESEKDFEYTVSWVDCLSAGNSLKGLFIRGNHSAAQPNPKQLKPKGKVTIPFDFPNFTLNSASVLAFNTLYYHKQVQKKKSSITTFDPFFYPLDAVLHWNRIYGSNGFLQYQFVVPYEQDGGKATNLIMEKIAQSGQGSFLAVLKVFGKIPGKGMLSFPRPGITLALDFKNTGNKLFQLLDELDDIVIKSGGAIYPAKDARMSRETFLASFPMSEEFKKQIDPKIKSAFSTRIGLTS
jgi:FAD/FMN-containing dehydrogenase